MVWRMLRCLGVKSTPTITLLALASIVVLTVGVYGLTLLFSQTVPPGSVRVPTSGSMTSSCSTLTPAKTIFDPGTSGNFSLTCNGGLALTVTSPGTFVPTFNEPEVYVNLAVVDFAVFQELGNCAVGGAAARFLSSGVEMNLDSGAYIYCVNYYVPPSYSSSTIASFAINWNTP